jgi:hypothetical protein
VLKKQTKKYKRTKIKNKKYECLIFPIPGIEPGALRLLKAEYVLMNVSRHAFEHDEYYLQPLHYIGLESQNSFILVYNYRTGASQTRIQVQDLEPTLHTIFPAK